jgi:nucleotide-binding universal stress UspA family protein
MANFFDYTPKFALNPQAKLPTNFSGGGLMYRNILVPVNNDKCSEIAVKHAYDISRLLGSSITLLHVIHDTPDPEKLEVAQLLLERLAEGARFKPKLHVTQTRNQSVAKRILEVAHELNTDLIVLGTHGRQGIERLKLGSVAQAVAGSADIPVQIIPLRIREAQDFASRWKEATDQGSSSQ